MTRKQPHAGHDHARSAVGTLKSAEVEEDLLERMQLAPVLQPLDCGDRPAGHGSNPSGARVGSQAVDQHRAGSALSFTATILGPCQLEIVAKHTEQASFWVGVNRAGRPVDLQFRHSARHGLLTVPTQGGFLDG